LPSERSLLTQTVCYQRLSIDGQGPPFCLHGLCAVILPEFGWYRIDARGNRDDVDAQFAPPTERLAFATDLSGEADLPDVHVKPLPKVVAALRDHDSWETFEQDLPDLPV
jgi:hypothetical protein